MEIPIISFSTIGVHLSRLFFFSLFNTIEIFSIKNSKVKFVDLASANTWAAFVGLKSGESIEVFQRYWIFQIVENKKAEQMKKVAEWIQML